MLSNFWYNFFFNLGVQIPVSDLCGVVQILFLVSQYGLALVKWQRFWFLSRFLVIRMTA